MFFISILGAQPDFRLWFCLPIFTGYDALVTLSGGSVSIFDLQLALGVSSEIGIVDDSLAVKFLGIGGKIGRKTQICVFDSCVGIDFGKLG